MIALRSKHYQLKRYSMYSLFALAALVAAFTVFQIVGAVVGQPRMMVVVGDSMLPVLKPYDVVFLEPADDNIKVGEIVAIDYSDYILFENYGYFVHRVIKVWEDDGKNFIQTKGDNNRLPESAIPADKVVGRMFDSVPYLGLLFGAPGNFIIIGAALLAAVYVRRKI